MTLLPSFKALIFAVALGFGVGFYTKGELVQAARVDAVIDAQYQTAQSIQQSLETSSVVEQKVAASHANIQTARKAVTKRLKAKETVHAPDLHAQPEATPGVRATADCGWALDLGTVGLLNDARRGTAPDPAGLGDATSQAPSGIGAAELIDNDLEIVGQYHDLATRHDALVDWVEAQIQKQAE